MFDETSSAIARESYFTLFELSGVAVESREKDS